MEIFYPNPKMVKDNFKFKLSLTQNGIILPKSKNG
nr:hypothetical protein pmam_69 [Pithovirus mammoth]